MNTPSRERTLPSERAERAARVERDFPCAQCGAKLTFKPGTRALTCAHCGTANQIDAPVETVQEQDFEQELARLEGEQEHNDAIVVHCDSCAAEVPMSANITSQACPFCGTPLVAQGHSRKLIRPKALLPFKIAETKAREAFRAWLRGLWFAPGDLKRVAEMDGRLKGFYLPFWTFDADANTEYSGRRGDDYWETEWVTISVNGRNQRQPRQVRRTRWTNVRGRVFDSFDDILIPASTSLPPTTLAALGEWDLPALTAYADDYLSGFQAESYTVGLKDGFGLAREEMIEGIKRTIRRDIGGDHQMISSMSPLFSEISFKHLLLPVWISAYRYGTKTYRFVVNARTGKTTGDRPYSAWKIALAVLLGLLVVGAFVAAVVLVGK